jgi:hypothetical protein
MLLEIMSGDLVVVEHQHAIIESTKFTHASSRRC